MASLCKLSRNRAVTYELSDPASLRSAAIVVVDSDDAIAVQKWKSAWFRSGTPVVLVSAAPLSNLETHHYNLLRNHLSGGLLQLLDRVAVNELGHRTPMVVSDHVAAAKPAPDAHPTQGPVFARALVIDDSLSVRTQMKLCLGKLGISAEVVEDGLKGLQKLQERYYDLVFLDVILPDMDGYQVCKLIKRDPRLHRVPVIMLTSKGSAINKIQGSIAGCDRYLVKPAAESDVVKVVSELLPTAREHLFRRNLTTLGSH
ncbi:MAG: response regulator [Arenicellales bacterium]